MSVNKSYTKNQFGEPTIAAGQGIPQANAAPLAAIPLPGTGNVVIMQGAGAPTSGGSGTGKGIAGTGSLYLDRTNGVIYQNSGTLNSPTWSGPGAPTAETLAAAGAISTTLGETTINNATGGAFVMTLAAPSGQDGFLKIIKLGTATNGATLAMTNIKGPGFCTLLGTTTLTFTASGDCVILRAVGTKWMLCGGNAVAS